MFEVADGLCVVAGEEGEAAVPEATAASKVAGTVLMGDPPCQERQVPASEHRLLKEGKPPGRMMMEASPFLGLPADGRISVRQAEAKSGVNTGLLVPGRGGKSLAGWLPLQVWLLTDLWGHGFLEHLVVLVKDRLV